MIQLMANNIKHWLSNNALGVSGYSASSFYLMRTDVGTTTVPKLIADTVNTIGHINTVLAMAIAIVTLSIKVIELVRTAKKKREEKDEAN